MNKEGQSEVTNRLRSAIKKKLAEISDFEDDELPEYIMILVANQRSKSQIEKDLSLFLRNDTVSFTNWLWALLNSLNVGNKNQKRTLSNSDSKESKQNSDVDDDAVILACGPDEQENDLLSPDESNDSLSRPSSRLSYSDQLENVLTVATENQPDKIPKKEKIVSTVKIEQNMPVTQKKQSPVKKECVSLKQEQRLLKKKSVHPLLLLNRNAKESVNSKVVPIKRRLVNSDDEYDPSKPGYINKSSYKVARNYSGAAALQANKLLLKAVDDATKSILVGQNIEDFYKPTPIKVLTSKRLKSSALPAEELETVMERNVFQSFPNLDYNFDVLQDSNEQNCPNYSFTDDSSLNFEYLPDASRRICLRPIPLISDSSETTDDRVDAQDNSEIAINPTEEVPPKSPHFIVTLEGVNLSFKNKLKENADDSLEDIEDRMSIDEYDDDLVPNEKVKVERCKYWPACKNSDGCIYHHPTVPCKCFPDCKFGDKCLYIHPNCKFDALCSRKDCPFTHASKRNLALSTHPMRKAPVKIHKPKVVCKFFPKCTATNCPFIHPKLCRYGKECRLPSCSFSHFSLPSRSQLKWKA